MNSITKNIPNKIKQPALCCIHCGKSYKKKSNMDKHFVVCDLLQISKKKKSFLEEEDYDEPLPSQQKMFQILIELGQKYNKLEEKVEELNKWIVKKKKKINVLDWLNTNIKPNINFDNILDKIIVNDDDILFLFENSFNDVLNILFERTIYISNQLEENPIFAFVQKVNTFYIYDANNSWIELSRERLIKFLNKVHMKIFTQFYEWKKTRTNQIRSDPNLATKCDKTLIKITGIDFKQETTLSKIKTMIFTKMKTDLKALVEYEFEF